MEWNCWDPNYWTAPYTEQQELERATQDWDNTPDQDSREVGAEPNCSDPNDWIPWYAEQQELQRATRGWDSTPADQDSFQQQLSHLQLSSSEESSVGLSSSETRPVRADIDNSMWMSPEFSLQDNRFSSTRYSVDIPRAQLAGSATAPSQSDLRDRAFSSMRYTGQSEAQPATRTKDSKSRGLFSRVKSGLGKVLGGDRREKSSGGWASEVVYSELRMDFAKRARPSDADLELIEQFKLALAGANRRPRTIANYERALKRFSEFIQPNGVTLKDLLGHPDLLEAYKDGLLKVAKADTRTYLGGALDTLRHFWAGGPISAPAWVDAQAQPMHSEDEQLIRRFEEAVKAYRIVPDGSRGRADGRVPAPTVKSNVQALRAFARWLREGGNAPLATRVYHDPESLAADIDTYSAEGGDRRRRLDTAISHLRRLGGEGLQGVGAGPRLMGRQTHYPYPEDGGVIDGMLKEALDELGPNATRRQKLNVSRQASELRRFSDWLQREARESIVSRLTGSDQQQRSLYRDFKECAASAGPAAVSFNRLRQYLGAEPKSNRDLYRDNTLRIDGSAEQELSRRKKLSEEGWAVPPERSQGWASSSDAHIGALGVGTSSDARTGAVLGDTEWLTDDHIERDYELLRRELRRTNLDFARRTRLVDPAIALQLSLATRSQAQRDFLHIVRNRHGEDNADFVFLPVSNASEANNFGGSHWSLLLVDRRNRARPIACHYDSARPINHEPAKRLAAVLGLRFFKTATMRQQTNNHDCGVFMVDGTRTLAGRLAEGSDLLNLDNLRPNRERLQTRLRARTQGDSGTSKGMRDRARDVGRQ
ncbi:Ulp1 family isopeptidase [Bradyrhizobium sp. CB3481]|uniref:Ulp1 family isopeptidase n=1 Tax=Bradyrhizobium sp. CB3481 TaxID=3039158 RepID=UPI0024B09B15|nr:Ulp1 family isopeptidase [Bradyrhizobium sp. CB3481]WFU14875.1 Ulp1 family isopeptidase [Bradyrhizobium sp. CB3481]